MTTSIAYFIIGLVISAYGLYIESNLVILPGVILQTIGAFMRCTDGMEIIRREIGDQQKTK